MINSSYDCTVAAYSNTSSMVSWIYIVLYYSQELALNGIYKLLFFIIVSQPYRGDLLVAGGEATFLNEVFSSQ